MKIECKTITPDHKPALLFRVNRWELEILQGLVRTALCSTPMTKDTKETIQRLRVINRGFKSDAVEKWLKENEKNT